MRDNRLLIIAVTEFTGLTPTVVMRWCFPINCSDGYQYSVIVRHESRELLGVFELETQRHLWVWTCVLLLLPRIHDKELRGIRLIERGWDWQLQGRWVTGEWRLATVLYFSGFEGMKRDHCSVWDKSPESDTHGSFRLCRHGNGWRSGKLACLPSCFPCHIFPMDVDVAAVSAQWVLLYSSWIPAFPHRTKGKTVVGCGHFQVEMHGITLETRRTTIWGTSLPFHSHSSPTFMLTWSNTKFSIGPYASPLYILLLVSPVPCGLPLMNYTNNNNSNTNICSHEERTQYIIPAVYSSHQNVQAFHLVRYSDNDQKLGGIHILLNINTPPWNPKQLYLYPHRWSLCFPISEILTLTFFEIFYSLKSGL